MSGSEGSLDITTTIGFSHAFFSVEDKRGRLFSHEKSSSTSSARSAWASPFAFFVPLPCTLTPLNATDSRKPNKCSVVRCCRRSKISNGWKPSHGATDEVMRAVFKKSCTLFSRKGSRSILKKRHWVFRGFKRLASTMAAVATVVRAEDSKAHVLYTHTLSKKSDTRSKASNDSKESKSPRLV